MLSLASFVQEHARSAPEHVAMRLGEKVTTYGQLEAAASAVATYLVSIGLKPGDHVALVGHAHEGTASPRQGGSHGGSRSSSRQQTMP